MFLVVTTETAASNGYLHTASRITIKFHQVWEWEWGSYCGECCKANVCASSRRALSTVTEALG